MRLGRGECGANYNTAREECRMVTQFDKIILCKNRACLLQLDENSRVAGEELTVSVSCGCESSTHEGEAAAPPPPAWALTIAAPSAQARPRKNLVYVHRKRTEVCTEITERYCVKGCLKIQSLTFSYILFQKLYQHDMCTNI